MPKDNLIPVHPKRVFGSGKVDCCSWLIFLKVNKYDAKLSIRREYRNNDYARMLKNQASWHNELPGQYHNPGKKENAKT